VNLTEVASLSSKGCQMSEQDNFDTYVAQRQIDVGDTGFKIEPGNEVLFDGHRQAVIGGQEFDVPNLKGCVDRGWLTPSNQPSASTKQSANVSVRKATPQGEDNVPSQNVQSGSREQVVSNVNQRGSQMTQRQSNRNQRQQGRSNQGRQSNQNVQQGHTQNVQQNRSQMPVQGGHQGQRVSGNFNTPAWSESQRVTRGTSPTATGGATGGRRGQGRGRGQQPRQGRQGQPRQQSGRQPNRPAQPQQRQGQQQSRIQGGNSTTRAQGMEFQNEGISNSAARKGGANGVNSARRGQQGSQYGQLNQPSNQPPQQPPAQPPQQSQPQQNVQEAQDNEALNDVDFTEEDVVDHSRDETEVSSVEPDVDVEIPDDYDLEDKQDRLDFVRQIFPDLTWDLEKQWKAKIRTLEEDFDDPAKVRAVYAIESVAMKNQIEKCFEDMFEGE
jgi:hypothetical protein